MADAMVVQLELHGENAVMAGLRRVASLLNSLGGGSKAAGVTSGVRQAAQSAALLSPQTSSVSQGVRNAAAVAKSVVDDGVGSALKAVDLLGFEATAAAAAVKLLWSAANDAAQALNQFRGAGYTSGGSGGEVAGLQTYGSVLGKSVSDMADLSRSLNRQISSSGIGMGFAQSAGMKWNFEPFGNQDMAKNLLWNMKAIQDTDKRLGRTATLQILRAIGPAAESLAPLLDMPSKIAADMAHAQALSEMVNTGRAAQDAAYFSGQLGLLGQNIANLKTAVGSGLLPVFTVFVEQTSDAIGGLTELVNLLKYFPDPLRIMTQGMQALHDVVNGSGWRSVGDDLMKAFNPDYVSGADSHTAALNRHAAALDQHTSALNDSGQDTRGAFPRAWVRNGPNASDALLNHSQALGGMAY